MKKIKNLTWEEVRKKKMGTILYDKFDVGKARKLKKLRRVAEALTQGTKTELQWGLRKKLVGEDPEGKKIFKTLAGTVRHAAGTTKEVYKKLKAQEQRQQFYEPTNTATSIPIELIETTMKGSSL